MINKQPTTLPIKQLDQSTTNKLTRQLTRETTNLQSNTEPESKTANKSFNAVDTDWKSSK